MVAISSAIEVDLTGQVCADSIGGKFYSGFGGQVDFIRGAARAEGGKPIIALPSTTKNGKITRIVPWLQMGAGVVTSRADVHYVVTEYGIASLHGKSVRERALALIHIAHPNFREQLLKEARDAKLVSPTQIALPAGLQPYPRKFEVEYAGRDDLKIHVRPIRPTDEGLLKELFYSHSPSTIYQRYFTQLKHLPAEAVQRMVTLDYESAMALVAEIPWEGRKRLIGVARYTRDAAVDWADIAVVVQEDFRQHGLASFLLRHLAKVASEQGIVGFRADVLPENQAMMRTFQKLAEPLESQSEAGVLKVKFLLENLKPV
jgi:GNAT superfamily N-acetyltransferase